MAEGPSPVSCLNLLLMKVADSFSVYLFSASSLSLHNLLPKPEVYIYIYQQQEIFAPQFPNEPLN
jgi:hypothetical protein